MKYYWVEFSNRPKGCIDAFNKDEALRLAGKHGNDAEIIGELPYPAEPRLERQSKIPSFCFRPGDQ